MKVTLYRDLATEHWHSMDRYANELESGLLQAGRQVSSYAPARLFPNIDGRIGAWMNYLWRSTVYPLCAASHESDVNHIVDHSYAHLIHNLDAARTVVTCHDVAPLALAARGQGISLPLWSRSFRAMQCAARIITDSEFTRREIICRSDFAAEQICAIPLGVAPPFFSSVPDEFISKLRGVLGLRDRRIVLHVGSCQSRKNVETVLKAMPRLQDSSVILVQLGGHFSPSQQDLIRGLGLGNRILQIPHVSEDDLRVWYNTADVFVYPSLYEGFGLPVLEAMASGAPVVCSNATSLPEVAGDAALLVAPRDISAWATSIDKLLHDKEQSANLSAWGSARAQLFTWERTARKTAEVYAQVYQERWR